MPKRANDKLSELAADIASPRVIMAIDKAMEEIAQEWLDLSDLRKMAVRRHGESAPAPNAPFALTPADTRVDLVSERLRKSNVPNIAGLITSYKSDERSTYKSLRFRTREHYDSLMRRIEVDCGERKLSDLKDADIQKIYDGWTLSGTAMAHAIAGMLRVLVNYGTTVLDDGECERVAMILHRKRFSVAKSTKDERLTVDHVRAIISNAHAAGLHSIALAQAFQFGCMLRQRDIIGEWVPLKEPGEPIVTAGKQKWLRGLIWSEIDKDLILRHPTSRSGKLVEFRLSESPMVMEELDRQFGKQLPTAGPVVRSENTELPYVAWEFRRLWRQLARASGVPDSIRNMDSTTGGYTNVRSRSRPEASESQLSARADRQRQTAEVPTN